MSNNEKLWRYMDLTKFLELVIHQKIYLNRSDNFEDKHEGELDYFTRDWINKNPFTPLLTTPISSNPKKNQYFINCWHQNDHESAAMWKLYGKINDSIAITTDLASLNRLLPKEVKMHKVTYFDDKTSLDKADIHLNHINLFTRKRMAFSHENEYRAIYFHENLDDKNLPNEASWINSSKKGINFSINVTELIKCVVISPYASNLIHSIIEDILKKYNLNDITVIDSELYKF